MLPEYKGSHTGVTLQTAMQTTVYFQSIFSSVPSWFQILQSQQNTKKITIYPKPIQSSSILPACYAFVVYVLYKYLN